MPKISTLTAATAVTLLLLTGSPAHAYVDPGMGSMVLQGLVGAVAATFYLLRRQWGRIRLLLRGGGKESGEGKHKPDFRDS